MYQILLICLMFLLSACGDVPESTETTEELGTAGQALASYPDWYGFGQAQGEGATHARYECIPGQTSTCYVPRGRRFGWSIYNDWGAEEGYSAAWWTDRSFAAMDQVELIADDYGFSLQSCGLGTDCPAWTNHLVDNVLMMKMSIAAPPNPTLDQYGYAKQWPYGPAQGRYKPSATCEAVLRPRALAASPLWCTAAPSGFPTQTDCNNLNRETVDNVWARQIWHCLGLGTYPDQGVTLGTHAMETAFGYTPFTNGYHASFWYTGLGILDFEKDLLDDVSF